MTASVHDDMDRIAPPPSELKLTNGSVVELESLRTRQFFRLLKILTRGAGPMLMEYRLDGDLTEREFQQRLIMLITLSIPEAEDEAIDFLRSMVRPSGLIAADGRPLTKQDRERNDTLWAGVNAALNNPELSDLVDLLEAIVRRESRDMQGLAKRLAGMMKMAEKTGQLNVPADHDPAMPTNSADPAHQGPTVLSTESLLTETQTESSAASPEPSISSPQSTDGMTKES